MTRPLSPEAQAVLEAYREASDGCYVNGEWIQDHAGQIAAALRAAADQVVPEQPREPRGTRFRWGAWAGRQNTRHELLAIAAELEGHHG